jgi:quercetin dioxygenase-like cupin family protein
MRIRLLAFALLIAAPAAADETESAQYQSLLTPLLSGNTTIIGQQITYPEGTPKVTAAVVVVAPGKETGWHIHTVPLFAYMLEGELTVDYGSKGVKVYKAGEPLLEAENWPHNGINKTDKPVRILAVYMGAEGITNAIPVAGPK